MQGRARDLYIRVAASELSKLFLKHETGIYLVLFSHLQYAFLQCIEHSYLVCSSRTPSS